MPDVIDSFSSHYFFLSNFFVCQEPIHFRGGLWFHVEGPYQLAKSLDPVDTMRMIGMSPRDAKKFGRGLDLRDDWELAKYGIMVDLVEQKFANNDSLRRMLLATGDALLIEGNTWGDREWGQVGGVGKNYLGKILMHTREVLA